MVVLDFSIVNVALPSIQRELGFSATGLEWVVTAYAITFGGLLILGGRAGDLLGRRRLFLAGYEHALVTAAAFAAAAAVVSAAFVPRTHAPTSADLRAVLPTRQPADALGRR
jgi:MFS family permease